jgi:GT2 family glycosyltransferase
VQVISDKLISIVIVNYKVPECLREAIRSVQDAELAEQTELVVVDNASGDNSKKLITSEFKNVNWIQLKNNVGFGKACNIGVQSSGGKYILLLNPDTVIAKDTLKVAVDFMQSHPQAGLMGPKILNQDGSLQASCRRGFVTPLVAFYYFTGISRLFPKSKHFARYHLTYMDENESAAVDAVSGSFMFIRRSLFDQLGGFDERFFMYGEDIDLCWRVRELGYEVWYHPLTQIIHRKGQSSARSPLRSRLAFYEAMIIFSKKYRHIRGGFFPDWLIFIGIIFLSVQYTVKWLFQHFFPVFIDMIIINTTLWIGMLLRFKDNSIYIGQHAFRMQGVHCLITFSFLFMFLYNGIYSKKRYTMLNALNSSFLATLLFFTMVYFVKSLAFSRVVFALSSVAISLLLIAYRELIPLIVHRFKRLVFSPERIVILGSGAVSAKIIKNIEAQKNGDIIGIVWDSCTSVPSEYQGYPVLGTYETLKTVFQNHKVDTLLIATQQSWYSWVIDVLSIQKIKNVTIRWASHELFEKAPDELPDEIELLDFAV